MTGMKGVISSVGFDLYGCIQAVLSPAVKENGELTMGNWFDIQRLRVDYTTEPVMEQPGFVEQIAQAPANKGPADKPVERRFY